MADSTQAIQWHPASENPDFYDGDGYLVAVAMHQNSGGGYEIHTIHISCDGDYFQIQDMQGDPWCWDWEDVSYWIKLDTLYETLPPNKGAPSA